MAASARERGPDQTRVSCSVTPVRCEHLEVLEAVQIVSVKCVEQVLRGVTLALEHVGAAVS